MQLFAPKFVKKNDTSNIMPLFFLTLPLLIIEHAAKGDDQDGVFAICKKYKSV